MRPLPLLLSSALLLVGPLMSPHESFAQAAPLEGQQMVLGIDSGDVEAPKTSRGPTVVFSADVAGIDAPWMRLHFDNVVLAGSPSAGDGSFLRLTSSEDGARQTLDVDDLQAWGFSSAYFNGSKVLLEIVAYPGTGPNRVSLSSATVGELSQTPRSICGEEDDRVPTEDPRIGRVLPAGCTAFIVDEGDCANRLLTAGHCLDGNTRVVQFNVPPSKPSGALVHPGPEDQYPVDAASMEGIAQGAGRDFGTFVVGLNSETGLAPRAAQGAAFHLADFVANDPTFYWRGVRVSGYGLDDGASNTTLQTDAGPLAAIDGTRLDYVLDTRGRNSGSPVIDLREGMVIGIHGHGGCHLPQFEVNSGTAIDHPGLVSTLDNGPAGTCEEHEHCVPDAYWYPDGSTDWSDAEPVDAWFDSENCFVRALPPTDGEPFVHGRGYYVTPGPDGVCEVGWFDRANCLLGYAPEWRIPFFHNGAFYYIE
ncbi:MAG: trypsin-like peptidase domain-containing protein [Acidobacteriota bacterium]